MHIDEFRSTQPAYLRAINRVVEAGNRSLDAERVAIDRGLRGAVRAGDLAAHAAFLFFTARNLSARNAEGDLIAYDRSLAYARAIANPFWSAITLIQRTAVLTDRSAKIRDLWEGIELLRPIEGAELDLLRARLELASRSASIAPEFAARVLDESSIDPEALGAFECNKLGTLCSQLRRPNAALAWFDRAIERAVAGHPLRIPFSYLGAGKVHANLGDHATAIGCFQKALESYGNVWHRPLALGELMRSLLAIGDSAGAERILREHVAAPNSPEAASTRRVALSNLAELIAGSDPRGAIECLEKVLPLAALERNDEVELAARRSLVALLRASADRAAYDRHIVAYTEALEREKERAAAAEDERIRASFEVRALTAVMNERERAAHQMVRIGELTVRELARQASATAAFADGLKDLKAELLLHLDGTGTAEAKLGSIRRAIDRQVGEAADSGPLEIAFTSIHPEFVPTLALRYPELTREEARVCMLLRMRLRSVDIARYLNRSLRSIENHRFRIRRKMALEHGASISDALAVLS